MRHLSSAEIREEIRELVETTLAEEGNESDEVIKIILQNIPDMTQITKPSQIGKFAFSFTKIAKEIKVEVDGQFINVAQWWKNLNITCNDIYMLYTMSISNRIRFLRRTGGLADGIADHYKQRVKGLMEYPAVWLPTLDMNTPESNERYWL